MLFGDLHAEFYKFPAGLENGQDVPSDPKLHFLVAEQESIA